jgi:hypothetical protein
MTLSQIDDLLNQQADRLVAGEGMAGGTGPAGLTSIERAGLSQEEQRTLGGLMQLARRVQAALVEVEPRPGFVTDLKANLVAQRCAKTERAADGGRGMLWVVGFVGALSMASLGILSYRVARAGVGWMSAAAASRNTRAALPKA